MKKSKIPILGLVHKCDVVRHIFVDDGAGGVVDTGIPLTLYASRRCRISTLDPNDVELKGYGFDARRHRKVVMIYSPKIQGDSEFIKVPQNVPFNSDTPGTAPDGTGESYTLVHLLGTVTLTWDESLEGWANSGGTIIIAWDSGNARWKFTDILNSFTWNDDSGISRQQNVIRAAVAPWVDGEDYVLSLVEVERFYRIVWHSHQIDDVGAVHHTSIVIELEQEDT